MSRSRAGGAVGTIKELVSLGREADVPFMAAAIAYYAFVSVLPALLLILSVGTLLGGEAFSEQVLSMTTEFLTPAGQEAIEGAIEGSGGRGGATVFGVLLLLWSTTRVFRGLDNAFSKVYGTSEDTGFKEQLVDAILVVGTIGIGIWGMLVLGGLLATVVPESFEWVGFVALLVGLVVVFLPLFYVFPDAEIGLAEALPGTVLSAIGWVVLQGVFQLYATYAGRYQLYGVIGGILLLVTWFYLAAGLLLAGAALNVVLEGRENRQLQQDGRTQ